MPNYEYIKALEKTASEMSEEALKKKIEECGVKIDELTLAQSRVDPWPRSISKIEREWDEYQQQINNKVDIIQVCQAELKKREQGKVELEDKIKPKFGFGF